MNETEEFRRRTEEFLSRVEHPEERSAGELIELFVYFLTIESGELSVAPSHVKACFEAVGISPYSNISQYLSRHLRGKNSKFVKIGHGYCLARSKKLELDGTLGTDLEVRKTAITLRELLDLVTTQSEREFLEETVDCYEIGAYRAAIVMGWLLAIGHLYDYIFVNKLADFNAQLANVRDRRVRISSISKKDDFSEIPESNFIEISRSAKIISGDVKKILAQKLDIRNSYAHPSGITVTQYKTTEFLTDLIQNVVLKYVT